MARYEVWEFWGRGDPFFGGNADDRVLYEVEPGVYQFLSGPEAARRKLSPAAFEDKVTAFQTGEVCARKGGRVVVCQARLTVAPQQRSRPGKTEGVRANSQPRVPNLFKRSSASILLPRRSRLEAAAARSARFYQRTQALNWRARRDSNPRPPDSKSGALSS
jgi:hypothetical protein